MSYIVGMTVNIITVVWLVFAIVFFSFPYVKPVSGMSPNPTSSIHDMDWNADTT